MQERQSRFKQIGEFDDCFGIWEPTTNRSPIHKTTLSDLFTKEIEETSDSIILSKFNKLSIEFLNNIFHDLQQFCGRFVDEPRLKDQVDIRFEVLQADNSNLPQVKQFYEILVEKTKYKDKDKLFNGKMTSYNNKTILFNSTLIRIQCENEGSSNPKQILANIIQNLMAHLNKQLTSLILIDHEFNVDSLQELKKVLTEEIEFNLTMRSYKNIVFVLPANQQMIINYQMSGLLNKKYLFTEPKKMFLSLLLELFKNTRIPLLSKGLYKTFLNQFDLYATSYQQQLDRLKLSFFLYAKECPKKLQDQLFNKIQDKNSQNAIFEDYIKRRQNLKRGLDTLQKFLKGLRALVISIFYNLKNQQPESQFKFQIENSKIKIFAFLCKDYVNFFIVPQNLTSEQNLNAIQECFISSIQEIIPNCEELVQKIELYINQGYSQQTTQILIYYQYQSVKSRKMKDRAMQMVQSVQIQDQGAMYLIDKRNRLESQINDFIKSQIIDNYDQLEVKYQFLTNLQKQKSEYVLHNEKEVQKHFAPDILEEYHNLLFHQQVAFDQNDLIFTPFQHLRNIYKLVAPGALNIRNSELHQEMPQIKQFSYEAFENGVTEMKILGLLEETKKMKPTLQKGFFAKSVYQNFTNE